MADYQRAMDAVQKAYANWIAAGVAWQQAVERLDSSEYAIGSTEVGR